MCRPWISMSSPVFTTTVASSLGERALDAAEELPRPDPARERHDLHRGIA